MRHTLLLTSFLAFLPFISATPSPDDPPQNVDPVIIGLVPLTQSGFTYTLRGCRSLGVLSTKFPPISAAGNTVLLTAETCVVTCHLNKKKWAGVGNAECRCGDDGGGNDFAVVDDSHCKQLTCPGDNTEYCGSSSTLILYESNQVY